MFMHDGGVLGFNSHYSYVFDTQWADLLAYINTIEDKTGAVPVTNLYILAKKSKQGSSIELLGLKISNVNKF